MHGSRGISRWLPVLHAHTWRTGAPNRVSVKGHAPEDACEHVSHYLQLLLGGSGQG